MMTNGWKRGMIDVLGVKWNGCLKPGENRTIYNSTYDRESPTCIRYQELGIKCQSRC